MRDLKQFLVAILVLTFIVACSKDDNDPNVNLDKNKISTKWLVSNSDDYDSFEFFENGTYIVIKESSTLEYNIQDVKHGTYEIIDNTLFLSDFGILSVSEIYNNFISFSIKPANNPKEEITINAVKQKEMESTPRTDLLCRSWKLISVGGESVVGTDSEKTVLFSKSGTYFVFDSEEISLIALWKWNDIAETQMLHSWKKTPNWEEEEYVEIIELSNNKLITLEQHDVDIEGEISIFVPSNN